MKHESDGRPAGRGSTLLLALNLLLCLIAAEILDLTASAEAPGLAWASGGLLVLLVGLCLWAVRKRGRLHLPQGPVLSFPEIGAGTARWLLVAVTLLAASLRFAQLGTESLWYDEIWTLHVADRPLGEILRTVNALPYLVTRTCLALGRSEYGLRYGSLLAGVLAVPVIYHLGRLLCGRREGLAAAFLFALAPYAIYHSQEVRFYAWSMLFSTLSLYFLLRGLRGNQIRDWTGFALATACNLHTRPFALLILAVQGVYVAYVVSADVWGPAGQQKASAGEKLRAWLRRAAPPGVAAVAALLAYAPQVPTLAGFYNPYFALGLESTPAAQPLYPSADTTYLTDPVIYWMHTLFGTFTGTWPSLVLVYPLLGLFMLGLLSSPKRTVLLSLLWLVLPMPLVLLAKVRFYPRYFGYFTPVILLLIARGAAYLAGAFGPRGRLRWVALALLITLVATPSMVELSRYYTDVDKEQWRELTAVVEARYEPGDLVLVSAAAEMTLNPINWYTSIPREELARALFPKGGILTSLAQIEALPGVTEGYDRVWMVFVWQRPEITARIVDTMERSRSVTEAWSFVGLELMLFEGGP